MPAATPSPSPTSGPCGNDAKSTFKRKALALCVSLLLANIGAWTWALLAFRDSPELLGICAVVYGLGLRHAIDADHITAIDNVTRKMMLEEKQSASVGFFFALGHSSVVIVVAAVVAVAAGSLGFFEGLQSTGGTISTVVSGCFLLAIAYMNVTLLLPSRRSGEGREGQALPPTGFLARVFRPVLGLVRKSWHMFPLGFLFGLGFDTATEISMFGVSAAQASKGVGILSVLVFPVLFTAAMSMVDTLDGVLMVQAYDWAVITQERRRLYNTFITLVSALTASVLGAAGLIGLLSEQVSLSESLLAFVKLIEDNINAIGIAMLGLFLTAWLASYLAASARASRAARSLV